MSISSQKLTPSLESQSYFLGFSQKPYRILLFNHSQDKVKSLNIQFMSHPSAVYVWNAKSYTTRKHCLNATFPRSRPVKLKTRYFTFS